MYICGMGLRPGQTTSTSFKVGNPGGGRIAGSTNAVDPLELIVKRHITTLEQLFDEDGIAILMAEIDELNARDRIQAKLTLLEYVKPKLARLEVTERKEIEVISVFGQVVESVQEGASVAGTDGTDGHGTNEPTESEAKHSDLSENDGVGE